jgi:hypothetical protein
LLKTGHFLRKKGVAKRNCRSEAPWQYANMSL